MRDYPDNLEIIRFSGSDMITSSGSIRSKLPRALTVLATAVVLQGCEPTTSPIDRPEAAVPTTISWIWNTGFDAYASQDVPSLPSVIVRDQFGRPMVGIRVQWTVVAGGGLVRFPVSVTNGEGVATLQQWTLGPEVGENVVTATVGGLLSQSFRVIAKPAPDPTPCAGCL